MLFIIINFGLKAQWVQQGPAPSRGGQVEGIVNREITGAINCVAPHPNNANILYIGGANSGVWRTGNATATSPVWSFISDDLPSQAIGALEFDPLDATSLTLVAGIGRTSSFYRMGSGGRGIFRTVNGLGPWTNIDVGGIFASRDTRGIAARGATIVVATDAGIYRTTDTGATWTLVSGAAGTGLPFGRVFDLVGDPINTAVLYTNAGAIGIYRSIDTGATWAKISNAAVDGDLVGAVNIEFAVGNANNVFVAIVGSQRALADLYRSGDGGTTWTAMDIPQTTELTNTHGIHPGRQGDLHLSLAADPTDDNIVYIGGDRQPWSSEPNPGGPFFPNSLGAINYTGRLFRVNASLATGAQSAAITHNGTAGNSSPHADSRDMDFNANGDLLEADDGGVYMQTSPNDATGDWLSLNGNLNATEFHSGDWDANVNIVIAGAQDNAVMQQPSLASTIWNNLSNGDGGDVAVDDISSTTSSTRYSSNQNMLSFRRRVFDAANTQVSVTMPALTDVSTGVPVSGFPFVTPIRLNSQNGVRLIVPTNTAVFESLDQGNTVTNIGNISVNSVGGLDAIAYGATDNPDIVYVGTGANISVRTTATGTLTDAPAYPGDFVQSVVVNPDESETAYVLDNNSVFQTSNAGVNWTDVTGDLLTLNPGILRSVAYIPNPMEDILAVGTDFGVYIATGPAFNVWSELDPILPNVPVLDLDYDIRDNLLIANLLGRGAWTYSFSTDLFARDTDADTGVEPNPTTGAMWQSPDIWIRQVQDATHTFAHVHQNAEYNAGTGNPNYVYVEVRNRGNTSNAGTEQLHVYWAKAGSGLGWPDPWNGGVYFDPGANTMLMGSPIGAQTIPVTPAGSSTILEFSWNPPDPMTYSAAFGTQTNHFCLLARITTNPTSPFGMTTLETNSINSNVRNNNNIVWKNIGVYDAVTGPSVPAQATLANLTKEQMNVKILIDVTDENGKQMFDKGCIKITPAGRLRDKLKKRPPAITGIRSTKRGVLYAVKDNAVMENISLEPREYGLLNLQFLPFKKYSRKLKSYAITITQIANTNGQDEVVGGQTFVFGKMKRFGTQPNGVKNQDN